VGTGLNNGTNNSVRALKAFDNGTGLSLYVGGYFTSAGGVTASRIAKWNGTAWSAAGTFDQGDVLCLDVFDHGTGPALYAGGTFLVADGAFAKHIARLGAAGWKELGGGLLGVVSGLTLAPFAEGPRLIVTGGFTQSASGIPLATRAAWDGAAWSPIGQTDPTEPGGADAALYRAQTPFQGLYFAGGFDQFGGVPAGRLARLSICEACPADCDADGVLSIDDFICFQTLFALGDPTADCDATGSLSIDDFICFQTAFAIGC
jgi:trimeric autotransporter adhesin